MDNAKEDRAGALQKLDRARLAQATWRDVPIRDRLKIVRRLRHLIVKESSGFVTAVGDRNGRTPADTMAAEVVPLAEACRFLEREASRILRSRRLGHRGRPLWLARTGVEIHREPHGVVLVLAPANYPLFLPGVQLLQAIVAGNAVLLKPAPRRSAVADLLCALLAAAGVPPHLVQRLDEDVAGAEAVIRRRVDHVVLTGSADTGRTVLTQLAASLTPATVELSGNDAVFVLPGAELSFAADAIAYGLRLNGGATCIAPRRVFVAREQAPDLERMLRARLNALPPVPIADETLQKLRPLLEAAERAGCRLNRPAPDGQEFSMSPVLVAEATPELALLRADIFAPVLSMIPVRDVAHALELDAVCPYALGASVFGPEKAALRLARQIDAGVVTINDLIVPTADPRLPFGGRGESGYGVTRGAEGLLNMTVVKAVSIRKGRFRPHYEQPSPHDLALFGAYLDAAHGASWTGRVRAVFRLARTLARRA
jgi:acyl-CoA reductase-like NAD-dependent aldehyde dehydrogenase